MTFVKPCKKTITTQRNMLHQPLTINRMSQPTHSKILLALICLVSALSLSSVHAEDNTTNIISGALLNNSATNYYVGRTGTNNYLEINSGGVLTNVAQGIIGSNATAIANSALVTGAGSVWYCTGVLTAGNAGSSNSLVIANGGTAKSFSSGTLGIGNTATAKNNSVLVTGAGSTITNSGSFIMGGAAGANNNSLTISNGGSFNSAAGNFIGNGGNNNSALVTGTGSAWNNYSGVLTTGNSGATNSLIITNGGTVKSFGAVTIYIGNVNNNNSVLVTGAGSTFTHGGSLTMGQGAAAVNNSLTISDGGIYNSPSSVFIGNNGNNNSVLVTGTGSAWNCTGGATFSIGNGATAASNRVTIAAGGAVTNTGPTYIGNLGANNSALVTGAGSVWNDSNLLIMGNAGATNNSLTVSNGGSFASGSSYIGNGTNANNTSVLVTGTGSVWNCSGVIQIVGSLGSSCSLIITNGGTVNSTGSIIVGNGSSNNLALVTGTGSAWNAPYSSLYLGTPGLAANSDSANYNSLTIANGGFLSVYDITMSNATCRVNFNQGTLQAGGASANFIGGLGGVYIQSGGAVIDIQGNTVAITNALQQDAASPGGGLTVLGTGGTLTLSGTNTYTGNTTVNGGTLVLQQPTLSAGSTITVTNAGLLQLAFAGSETNQVAALVLNGVNKVAGVYNSTTDPAYLSGAGSLRVGAAVATYSTNITYGVSGSVLTLTWPESHLGWYVQSNSVSLTSPSSWFDIPGSQTATNLSITINPALPQVFYRMRLP